MANRWYTQFFGTLHKKPVLLDCSFTVDPSNTNGLGVSSLTGPGIANVYMHTSQTPASGNPNPASGYILVQFQDNFYSYLQGFSARISPVTGSAINISGTTVMTVGVPYVITSVGTSTQANWAAAGLPAGLVSTVGQPFIAAITGGGTGTGQVKAVGTSGGTGVEVVGNPNTTLGANYNGAAILGGSAGSYMILQCLNGTTVTAPTALSVMNLSFYMSNSYVSVQGG